MASIVLAILKQLPAWAFVIFGIIVFYEGVPVVSWLPLQYVSPFLGDLAEGRVHIKSREATAALRAEYEAARQKMLAQIAEERAAKARQIDEIERGYLRTDAARAIEIGRLKELLDAEEDAPVGTPPAVPKRLSDALNRIGN